MKPVKLFTAAELDPMMASIINARFNSFLVRFCTKNNLVFEKAVAAAKEILTEGEIQQDYD